MKLNIDIPTIICLTALWLGSSVNQTKAQSTDSETFWAAKYSQRIDQSRLQSIFPEMQPVINATNYYIQYGDHTFMELRHPDDESSFLPLVIKEWNYRNGTFLVKMIYRDVKKFSLVMDSIRFGIEDSRSTIKPMCDSTRIASQCDSVFVLSRSTDAQHLVVLINSLPNMRVYNLLYPDIKNLPKFIGRQDIRRTPLILEEVIYGRHAIDLLLSTFSHEGYELITDEEMNSFELQIPLKTIEELVEELDRINRAKD